MGTVYIIKNKLDSTQPIFNGTMLKNAEDSYNSNSYRYYNSNKTDGKELYEMKKNKDTKGIIMFISYTGSGKLDSKDLKKSEIESIYMGEGVICDDTKFTEKCNINYKMTRYINNIPTIINLLDDIELDLGNDFEGNSYLSINNSNQLYRMLMEFLIEKPKVSKKCDYNDLNEEYVLASYAQQNKNCVRMYGSIEENPERNEFQRDRERIVNSKAFRRLVDKAQIFSAKKGDHYRTRMTHTLEVNQIAKAISSTLKLNLDLTEAIALGHDLGHTPFGHQGERTLKEILYGEKLKGLFNIDKSIFTNEFMGGFKHNYQSIRVLTKLEEKYIEFPGLDISIQALEGILKHTKLKDAQIDIFINKEFKADLHENLPFATTLEGQVVAVADEIAQRGHDIDDAITSGLITTEELIEVLNIEKFTELHTLLFDEKEYIDMNKRHYVSINELTIGRIVSCIVGFFIRDVISNSKVNIETYTRINKTQIFEKKLVDFSPEVGKPTCDFLEKVVNKKVIGNSEVACFDYNADVIIEKLFEAYYKNPKLLHKGTLRKIYVDQIQHEDKRISNSAIDLINGNLDVIRYEIDKITNIMIMDSVGNENYEILEKRKILVRNIVDYISGMTDSYAINEYEKIK